VPEEEEDEDLFPLFLTVNCLRAQRPLAVAAAAALLLRSTIKCSLLLGENVSLGCVLLLGRPQSEAARIFSPGQITQHVQSRSAPRTRADAPKGNQFI